MMERSIWLMRWRSIRWNNQALLRVHPHWDFTWQTLITLALFENQIGDDGAWHLADALKFNRVGLRHLSSAATSSTFSVTDTDHTRSPLESNQCCWCTASSRNTADEWGLTRAFLLKVIATPLSSYRQSRKWTWVVSWMVLLKYALRQKYYGSIRWDSHARYQMLEHCEINRRQSSKCLFTGMSGNSLEYWIWLMHWKFIKYERHMLTPMNAQCNSDAQTLTTLEFQSSETDAVGARYLADALKVNQVTSTCTSKTASPLWFSFPQTLIKLNLQYNRIDDDGAQNLADALKINQVGPNPWSWSTAPGWRTED
jgi:hypothetical protein